MTERPLKLLKAEFTIFQITMSERVRTMKRQLETLPRYEELENWTFEEWCEAKKFKIKK